MKVIAGIIFCVWSTALIGQQKTTIHYEIKEGSDHKKLREAWIREMHRAEPGINTDLLDELARQAKAEYKMELMRNRFSIKPQAIEKDTLAEGRVIGSWSERGSNNIAGRMHTCDVDWDSDAIYAASSFGNIWKGTLAGNAWECLNDQWRFRDVRLLRVIPNGSRKRLVVVANGPAAAYYSDDNGKTWRRAAGLDGPASWGYFRKATVSTEGDTIHLLGQEWDYTAWKSISTLYISTDKGRTFRNVLKVDFPADRFDIWRSRLLPTPLYAIKGDTVGIVGDSGTISFLSTTPGDPYNGYFTLKGSVVDSTVWLTLFAIQNGNTEIYSSVLPEMSWEYTGYYLATPFDWNNSLMVSESDPAKMYFGAVHTMRSFDAGVTWDTVNRWWEYYDRPVDRLHADIPGFEIIHSPTNEEYTFISTDGGLYVSTDDIATVTNLTLNNIGTSQYYSTLTSAGTPANIYAGSQDQGYQKTNDNASGKLDFIQTISGDYGHLTSSDGGSTVWCNYPGFSMLYLHDQNDYQRAWDFEPGNRLWIPPIVADPDDPLTAYVASGEGEASALWKLQYVVSSNFIDAERLPFDFSDGSTDLRASALAISLLNRDHWYVLTNDGRFYYSNNNGADWVQTDSTNLPGAHYFYGNSILPSQKHLGELYIAGSGYSNPGVYHSTDHGATFTPVDSGLPHTLIFDIAQTEDEQFLFAATEIGPYIFSKEALQWFDMAALSAPDHVYWTVEYVPASKVVRFGTYGRGIWDFAIEKATNAVERPPSHSMLALAARYAPDNTSVRFDFALSRAGNASLRIYDETGKIVRELCNTYLSAGTHGYRWDFTDRNGAPVSSGPYLAIISANGNVAFSKIVNF